MKCQSSGKKKKNVSNLFSAEVAQRVKCIRLKGKCVRLSGKSVRIVARYYEINTTVSRHLSCFYTLPHYNGGVLWFHVGRQCLSVHPFVCRPSAHISFLDDNLSKHQLILNKLGMCIDIVEIWFWIANGQISLFLTKLSASHTYAFISGQ